MNLPIKAILGLILGALILTATGCSTNPATSGMPWGRPAGWENQVPGMGGAGMGP